MFHMQRIIIFWNFYIIKYLTMNLSWFLVFFVENTIHSNYYYIFRQLKTYKLSVTGENVVISNNEWCDQGCSLARKNIRKHAYNWQKEIVKQKSSSCLLSIGHILTNVENLFFLIKDWVFLNFWEYAAKFFHGIKLQAILWSDWKL